MVFKKIWSLFSGDSAPTPPTTYAEARRTFVLPANLELTTRADEYASLNRGTIPLTLKYAKTKEALFVTIEGSVHPYYVHNLFGWLADGAPESILFSHGSPELSYWLKQAGELGDLLVGSRTDRTPMAVYLPDNSLFLGQGPEPDPSPTPLPELEYQGEHTIHLMDLGSQTNASFEPYEKTWDRFSKRTNSSVFI